MSSSSTPPEERPLPPLYRFRQRLAKAEIVCPDDLRGRHFHFKNIKFQGSGVYNICYQVSQNRELQENAVCKLIRFNPANIEGRVVDEDDPTRPENVEAAAFDIFQKFLLSGRCPHLPLVFCQQHCEDTRILELNDIPVQGYGYQQIMRKRQATLYQETNTVTVLPQAASILPLPLPLPQHPVSVRVPVNNPPVVERANIILAEYGWSGTLDEWLWKHIGKQDTPHKLRTVIFQVLFTIGFLLDQFDSSFRHNDLGPSNILIQEYPPKDGTYFAYCLRDQLFIVPDIGIRSFIWDFDFVNANNRPGLQNAKVFGGKYQSGYGISTAEDPRFDLHYFLNSLYVAMSTQSQYFPPPPPTADRWPLYWSFWVFLELALPSGYRGPKTDKVVNHRLAMYAPREDLPTPIDAMMLPYFHAFHGNKHLFASSAVVGRFNCESRWPQIQRPDLELEEVEEGEIVDYGGAGAGVGGGGGRTEISRFGSFFTMGRSRPKK